MVVFQIMTTRIEQDSWIVKVLGITDEQDPRRLEEARIIHETSMHEGKHTDIEERYAHAERLSGRELRLDEIGSLERDHDAQSSHGLNGRGPSKKQTHVEIGPMVKSLR